MQGLWSSPECPVCSRAPAGLSSTAATADIATPSCARPRVLVAIAIASAATLCTVTIATPAPSSAHPARGLGAKVLTANYVCDELTWPYCTIQGRIRVQNNWATTLGICVGIDGTPLPDGVRFTLKMAFKTLGKTVLRTAMTVGGKVRVPLKLAKSFAGHSARFVVSRRTDTTYQAVRSPRRIIEVR
jgi:hypothetical protein